MSTLSWELSWIFLEPKYFLYTKKYTQHSLIDLFLRHRPAAKHAVNGSSIFSSHLVHTHTLVDCWTCTVCSEWSDLAMFSHTALTAPPLPSALQIHFFWKIPLNRNDLWLSEHPLTTSFSKPSVSYTSVKTKAGGEKSKWWINKCTIYLFFFTNTVYLPDMNRRWHIDQSNISKKKCQDMVIFVHLNHLGV